jgi:3-deoxy-D-manno-octulosonic-acid transferase
MSGLLLDIAYLCALVAASPFWLYRMIRYGRYREDIAQRFGAVPRRPTGRPAVWIHGVSLGEINAARALVQELQSRLPRYEVVISSTTETGMAAAKRLFGAEYLLFRWPLDFSLAVRRAIRRIRPDLVVLMEGEVWPNFLIACNEAQIPVAVVNARMSADKGYPGYRRLGPLAALLFNRVSAYGVQDESYARRYRDLGVDPDRLNVTGMMKFDTAEVSDTLEGQDDLAIALGIADARPLIVAGGTGPGEERILLEGFRQLQQRHPEARLAIVPRKPERFDEVARLIESEGFALVRRSQRPDGTPGAPCGDAVVLGDTMGELRKLYALATCIFVGRSLVDMGGSDMIEAAALGRPTAFGPYTQNFPQADALAENGCARVADGRALVDRLDQWLSDPDDAARIGREAQQYVRTRQGATQRNVEMLCRLLKDRACAQGTAAHEPRGATDA